MALDTPHHHFPSTTRDRPDEPAEPPFDLDPLDDLRPLDDPTWRDRLDDLLEVFRRGPLRFVGPAVGLLVLAGCGWWLLRPPASPPIEALLPHAAPPDAVPAAGSGPAAAPTETPGGPGTGAAPGAADPDGPADGADAAGAPEEPVELVVAVAGAVARPGVHRLPEGSRVDDAIRIAGGMTAEADGDRLNLAAPLVDGERIWVPSIGEDASPEVIDTHRPRGSPASAGGDGADGSDDAEDRIVVDLNTATETELEALPGVGPATARAIVEHRERIGVFATVDQLLDVRGIGEVKLEQIRPHATV